ncbi:hypothetical protein [Neobacillus mesonae]|uniref:hypothetical protein n=1 Tax=Neobacillus mesonae TaxID=1193713 RepID=UPI0025734BDD|nr:hypothetical protein [Neobacillus mesonae]MED4205455.1 hypothetical protein [Neobacillus mesonae]
MIGIFYLVRNLVNLKMTAAVSKDALYPKTEEEFAGIIIPIEWKEMEPISKKTKSYRYVKWGTIAVLCTLIVLLVIALTTDWLRESYISLASLLFLVLNAVRHPGSLYILPKGIILNGKFVFFHEIKHFETEQIVRWHHLYGLDEKVNNAYKLTFKLKRTIFQPEILVVRTAAQLEQITSLLEQRGVHYKESVPKEGA